jgi:hypothetical protein
MIACINQSFHLMIHELMAAGTGAQSSSHGFFQSVYSDAVPFDKEECCAGTFVGRQKRTNYMREKEMYTCTCAVTRRGWHRNTLL